MPIAGDEYVHNFVSRVFLSQTSWKKNAPHFESAESETGLWWDVIIANNMGFYLE